MSAAVMAGSRRLLQALVLAVAGAVAALGQRVEIPGIGEGRSRAGAPGRDLGARNEAGRDANVFEV